MNNTRADTIELINSLPSRVERVNALVDAGNINEAREAMKITNRIWDHFIDTIHYPVIMPEFKIYEMGERIDETHDKVFYPHLTLI